MMKDILLPRVASLHSVLFQTRDCRSQEIILRENPYRTRHRLPHDRDGIRILCEEDQSAWKDIPGDSERSPPRDSRSAVWRQQMSCKLFLAHNQWSFRAKREICSCHLPDSLPSEITETFSKTAHLFEKIPGCRRCRISASPAGPCPCRKRTR